MHYIKYTHTHTHTHRVGLVAADPDNLDNTKEVEEEAQGTSRESFESSTECLRRQGQIAQLCAI